MNIVSSITSSIASSIIATSSALAVWFKLLTTDPVNSSPTQGATVFSRATGGKAFDSNGLLVSYAPHAPRQQDGGLLIEQASTNSANPANWRTAAGYISWNAGTTIVADQVGIDGVANKAVTIADTSASSIASRAASIITITADTNTHWQSIAVKKSSAAYIPRIQFQIRVGASVTVTAYIDTVTGQLSASTPASVVVESRGDFWIVKAPITNNGAGTRLDIIVYPAARATLNSASDQTLTGSCVVDWTQVELNKARATSPGAAGATRAADICYTANANIPTLANGATFVWKGALPNDGVTHTAFRSSPMHTLLRRMPNGNVQWWLGAVALGNAAGIDTATHTYAIRTSGSGLHELLIDGVVVATSTATGLLQPTTPIYIGSTSGAVEFLNDSTQSFATYDKRLTDAEIQGLG